MFSIIDYIQWIIIKVNEYPSAVVVNCPCIMCKSTCSAETIAMLLM